MKVIFLDTVHPILWERLSAAQFKCHDATQWSYDELLEKCAEFEGVVLRSRFVLESEFFKLASNLKFVARSGSGLENIDLDSAREHDVAVFNSPEGNAGAVGEHAIALLLGLLNKINSGHLAVQQGNWPREEHRGEELDGKTVGIIGLGHTGTSLANKLSGFDCKVIAYDKYKPFAHAPFAERVEMDRIFSDCDVVSLHLPLTNETRFLVNDKWIQKFAKPIILLNTSRGKIVDTDAVAKALEDGDIRGAGIDVLEYEKHSFEQLNSADLPDAFQRLIKHPRVLLSPHVAGWTKESYVKLSSVLADKILAKFQA